MSELSPGTTQETSKSSQCLLGNVTSAQCLWSVLTGPAGKHQNSWRSLQRAPSRGRRRRRRPRRRRAARTDLPGRRSAGRIQHQEPSTWCLHPSAAGWVSGMMFSCRCTEPAGGWCPSARPRWETGSGSRPARTGNSVRPEARGDARWPVSCYAGGRRSSGWPRSARGGGTTGAGPPADSDTEGWHLEERDTFTACVETRPGRLGIISSDHIRWGFYPTLKWAEIKQQKITNITKITHIAQIRYRLIEYLKLVQCIHKTAKHHNNTNITKITQIIIIYVCFCLKIQKPTGNNLESIHMTGYKTLWCLP